MKSSAADIPLRSVILITIISTALLSACEQGTNPPAPVDLKAAATAWNTADITWNNTELTQLEKGKRLYLKSCSACHLSSGEGQINTIGSPPLKGGSIASGSADALIRTVLDGRNSMPSFRNSLGNAELAALLSYVRNAWGNNAGTLVKESTVNTIRPET